MNPRIKRLLSLLLALTMVFSLTTPVSASAASTTAASSNTVEIEVGETAKLKVSGVYAKTTWTSSDEAVATVSSTGTVTGIAPGTTTITASSRNFFGFGIAKVTKYTVTVVEPEEEPLTVKVGETLQLEVETSGGTVTWKSSDKRIATVNGKGLVTGVSEGDVIITATEKKVTGNPFFWWAGSRKTVITTTDFEVTVLPGDEQPTEPEGTEPPESVPATPIIPIIPTLPPCPTDPKPTDPPETEPPVVIYTVTFESNGGSIVEDQTVAEGECAVEPEAPTMEGYTFTGWYSDAELTTAYDFATPITDDVTLYAAWKTAILVVSFDINCDGDVADIPESQDVVYGECAMIPAEPSRDGYLFAGWFENSSTDNWTDSFSFDTPICENKILYAIWVDATTDDDQDGLSDDLEDYMGTSTELDDSDNDGLDDYEDKILFDYDPTLDDTDGDGILDGDEDHDEDGLTNAWELENGTNPILKDTDNDGLNDYDEVNTYGTDPVNQDTDGDAANDGDEVRLGTDPLTAETQFVESTSFGELTENLQVTVDVEATVNGEQVGTIEVVPVTTASNPVISPTIPGYLGCAFDISTNGQPQSAVITFRYDTSLGNVGDDFQPRVYYYNEETKTFEELPDQIVTDGQVQVAVEHFSTYILLDKVEFDQVWETEIKPPDTENQTAKTLSIVFVIDVSGSMSGTNISTVKTVMESFINSMGEEDRAAIVKFASSASLVQSLTNDKTALTSAISGLSASGGTTISNGVSLGIDQLVQDTTENSYDTVILLTDGQDSSFDSAWSQYAQSCVDNNIIAYSIGIGSSVSSSHLTSFAEGTGGKYYHAEVADELEDYFVEIKGETIDYTTDSNDDGISDYYTELIESGELPLSNGSLEFMGIDFNYNENGELSDDYDMDGVKNGAELIVKQSGNRVYVYKVSDPMMPNSDADNYDDGLEHQRGTDPMVYTYEDDSVDYPWDDDNFTYIGVFDEEDKWWNEGAREIWSSITFNWSHQDESKRLLASFFDTFSNVTQIEDMSDKIEMEVANQMGEDLIGQAVKLYKYGNLSWDAFKETRTAIKRWQAAGNSAKNLSPDHITQFKAQLGLFNYKYTFKGFSKADKIGMGVSFAIDEANDIYGWIQAYSAITATQSAFEENRDILERIKANDDAKEKFVTRAAEDILLVINEEYGAFKVEQAKDLALATTENVAELALTMLSKANPYVMAVQLAIGLLDMLTPATEIAEATYCLYVIDELVLAAKDLFAYESKTEDYYDIEETNTRHIELLICARMWGGEFAKTITGNQHYWGLFNDDEIRQEYADSIDYDNGRLEEYLSDFVR